MHYHLEIIMPPVENIESAIEEIMQPFDENNEDNRHSFWDWYQIGGRYSGSKLESLVPQEQLDAFYAELKNRKVTVSGFTAGKQEISPASQIPMVDELWREICPGSSDVCPLFNHSGQCKKDYDICTLDKMPELLSADAVIIAAPNYNESGLEAKHLIHKSIWNGVSCIDTKFNGNVKTSINDYINKLENYKDEYKEKYSPREDWLIVTVDYHS